MGYEDRIEDNSEVFLFIDSLVFLVYSTAMFGDFRYRDSINSCILEEINTINLIHANLDSFHFEDAIITDPYSINFGFDLVSFSRKVFVGDLRIASKEVRVVTI